jgi:hypothetical protein
MIRMFWSTDIADATLYKARCMLKGNTTWSDAFQDFFWKYPIKTVSEIEKLSFAEERLPDTAVWRFMGDEVIFISEPASPEEVTLLLVAYFKAMTAYEDQFLVDLPLRLKATAWLARFPSPNIQIEVPALAQHAGATHTDYIGPDMDVGFRIAKFARPSTISVTLDLVETVLHSANHGLLDFFFGG